jgi:hypothetical protein
MTLRSCSKINESSFFDLIGNFLSRQLGDEGESEFEARSGSSARHNVAVDDDAILSQKRCNVI